METQRRAQLLTPPIVDRLGRLHIGHLLVAARLATQLVAGWPVGRRRTPALRTLLRRISGGHPDELPAPGRQLGLQQRDEPPPAPLQDGAVQAAG